MIGIIRYRHYLPISDGVGNPHGGGVELCDGGRVSYEGRWISAPFLSGSVVGASIRTTGRCVPSLAPRLMIILLAPSHPINRPHKPSALGRLNDQSQNRTNRRTHIHPNPNPIHIQPSLQGQLDIRRFGLPLARLV